MKLSSPCLALLAVVALLCSLPLARDVHAQEGTTIAVVDVQRLLQESLAGQSIESQLQQARSAFGNDISQKETALRDRERQLVDQSAILAAEVLAEERRKFEEEVIALQREVRERQQGMEQAYAEAIATVRENVIAILQNLVEQRGIDVVLPRSGYLVANRELDLTDEILGELNQVLPSLTLDLP
ncbi:MAG: OmpH family outer membrane protein [Alphaproteobacteria bacterium]|jgi:outer membrane protein|nr:OmpH family outer membrane protein [Rhodospirillaceae bacterium]MBT6511095.1 OmpH family outer membrane protein [Rhodospirillaceae bacterium]MBT7614079.1 OmpH family outer membrane protein [Rhodospirillaceae bacterium]MDG2481115.1 OmpH family outer membrane protein [Alphaproteobacteria bacterium]